MHSIAVFRSVLAALVATLGLAFTLTSSAQAATSMSGTSVKKGTLPGDRIKQGTVTGKQVKESSLGLVPLAGFAKLADSARLADHAKTADTATTAQTAKTADTAKSADTATTADDAKKLNGRDHTAFQANAVRIVTKQAAPVPGPAGGYPSDVSVSCDAGEKAVGGGAAWIIPNFQDDNQPSALDAPITGSYPTTDAQGLPTGWRALGRNFAGTDRALRAYVMCSPKTA